MQSPPSVCLSVCFHCNFWTEWSLTFISCICTGHDYSFPAIKSQGQGSRSRIKCQGWKLTRSVWPRSSIKHSFLVCSLWHTALAVLYTTSSSSSEVRSRLLRYREVSDQTPYSREPVPCFIESTQVKVSGTASWHYKRLNVYRTSPVALYVVRDDLQ